MVAVGTIVFLAGAGAVGFVFWKVSQDLPDYEGLAKYAPPGVDASSMQMMAIIAEFARERRIHVPRSASRSA